MWASIRAGRPALLVIDAQRGFADPSWGPRDNPDAVANILRLVDGWRAAGDPIVLVRHDSQLPESPLRPGQEGNDFIDGIDGPHDLLVTKTVNSAFLGTPALDDWLRAAGIDSVTICGITTNHCCETTARMAGNLGYDTDFVIDATHTFDRAAADGTVVTASELSRITGVNLDGEFARVTTTAAVLGERAAGGAAAADDAPRD